MGSVGVLHFVPFSTTATVLPPSTTHNFYFDNPFGIWLCRAIVSLLAPTIIPRHLECYCVCFTSWQHWRTGVQALMTRPGEKMPSVLAYSKTNACVRWLCKAVGMLKSLPFGRRKSLTLECVSRRLRGPHYIVQSIALSTRNLVPIHRFYSPHMDFMFQDHHMIQSPRIENRQTLVFGAYRMAPHSGPFGAPEK